MILVDARVGSYELQSLIRQQGILCDKEMLDSADACFEGYGPEGQVLIGIERKKLQDALDCIDTGRLAGFQLPKMRRMYRFRFIVIEGLWRPEVRSGLMLEGHAKGNSQIWWSDQRPGGRREMYHKLRRFTFSLMMAGCYVLPTYEITHTAYDICELYHWFQKPWHKHISMNVVYSGYAADVEPKSSEELVMIPTIDRRPSLTRMWAKSIPGVGVQLSADAERVFKTPIALATADEGDWTTVPGVNLRRANEIVKLIQGGTR